MWASTRSSGNSSTKPPGIAPEWCSQIAPRPRTRPAWGCGWVAADLRLSDRTFCCRNPHCLDCGLILDRDQNAARKLAQLAQLVQLAGRSVDTPNACGGESAGPAS